jgi:hypothetical protein
VNRRIRPAALLWVLLLVAAACSSGGSRGLSTPPSPRPSGSTSGSGSESAAGERAGESYGEEGDGEEGDADRIQRLGVAPRTGSLRQVPAPGWVGERVFGNGNDWEPATATDPNAPYVYLLTTRYSGRGPLDCAYCDLPDMALKVSDDGGDTFGDVIYLPPGRAGGQYDPQIETDDAGTVYSAFINGGFRIVFTKSTDHGRTWSEPVNISSPAGWADHPWLGVSPDGQRVCVAFNHASSWVSCSSDGGDTWPGAVQISTADRYYYANGDVVRDDGTVIVSNASYRLRHGFHGSINVVVSRSTDGGATWDNQAVDNVAEQPPCTNNGCPHDHYGGQYALGSDDDGDLVLAYDGAIRPLGAQYIWTRHSEDDGVTWSDRTRISPRKRGIVASFTSVVGTGDGDFRVLWQDSRHGIRRWNTFVRRSTDGGLTWGPESRISDARGGRDYKHRSGYDADYGDFTEVDVTDTGRTIGVWGEGFSYYGPGGTWFNVES